MTKIYLTIDLECKTDSPDYNEQIFGRINGHHEEVGLDFILRTLKKYNLQATFFVEPFFSLKFGKPVLRQICDKILSDDHDIQLHLHPYFKSTEETVVDDNLYTHKYENQVTLIQEGKQLLLDCGVPSIKAFRAGAFAANHDTCKALAACEIKISSNYNLDYLNKTCQLKMPRKFNDFFIYENGILEAPVTAFKEFNFLRFQTAFRHMQITAVSFWEMRHVLLNAEQYNLRNITILFHTFEFITQKKHRVIVDQISLKRFLKLCKFLSNNREKFNVSRFSDIDLSYVNSHFNHQSRNIPSMPKLLTFIGKTEQVKKRIF